MSNLYELSRFVFPTQEYADYTDLFLRNFVEDFQVQGNLCKTEEVRFDTWMNLFDSKKYNYYCDIGQLYIQLKIDGNYRVVIKGVDGNDAVGKIETILVSQDCTGEVSIPVPNYADYEGVYLSLFYDVLQVPVIHQICWCTDKAPVRQNILSVVSCTFKREKYITRNIKKFENFLEQNSELKPRMHLVVSDNGQSLPGELNSKYTSIYPNMNAGGAGGFARGMLEVLKKKDGTTRILLMDDDVEMFPEAFHKTLLLCDYLKEEFKDSFISGAMLDLYQKNRFIENVAVQFGYWVNGYHEVQQINNVADVLRLNKFDPALFEKENCHSAWWYHCFDVVELERKMPVPVFFRCDDIQWSWASKGKQHIFTNGINVWHAPFEWRTSKTTDYYFNIRNMFLARSLHDEHFKKLFPKYFKDIFDYLITTNDYVSTEVFLKAMQDILKGKEIFKENPSIVFKELANLNKKSVYKSCCEFPHYQSIKKKFEEKELKLKSKWYRIKLAKLTKGIGVPKFLFKKTAYNVDFGLQAESVALVKKLVVFNLFTGKAEIREYNAKKVRLYQKNFKRLLKQMIKNYDEIHQSLVDGYEEFKTVEFWEKYLGLK